MNPIQFLTEGIRIAVGAIRSNRLRSILTMLGVATGIFAIVGILTMVNSMQTSVTESVASLGNTTIFVHHWPWAEGGNEWYKFINRPKVSYRDYQKLKQNLSAVRGVCYQVTVPGQTIKASGRSVSNIQVVGTTHDIIRVSDIDLSNGRFFSEVESRRGASICVIGHNIATNLFPNSDPIGQHLVAGGKRLEVVGVQTRQGAPLFPGPPSEDDRMYIPYAVLPAMFNQNIRSLDKLIIIKANTYEDVPLIESEIVGNMRAVRGLKAGTDNNFAINKQEMLMNSFARFFGFLKTGGWVISIFSILIGGFSIGNIMYICVRERTNEIGVQKALGATRGFILYQFVVESVLICLSGGLVGMGVVVLLGLLVQGIMSAAGLPFTVSIAPGDMVLGLTLSVGTGLVSGIIPASMAASTDPVTAIRHA
ncbi:MAG: ABC transporter permease [Bacteroidia bacterium]|nr:ABC transporter permease [Bacteroidia bacterium]